MIVGFDVASDKSSERIQNIVDNSPEADFYYTGGAIMFELVRKLNEECGVREPEDWDQDWEFCAGDYTRTEDYIKFYKKYSEEMDSSGKYSDKRLLSDMIIQGIEDLLRFTDDTEYAERLWKEFRQILIDDELYDNIVYWSCIGQPIENCWKITSRMRDLLRELI